jgi:hypothetical protein
VNTQVVFAVMVCNINILYGTHAAVWKTAQKTLDLSACAEYDNPITAHRTLPQETVKVADAAADACSILVQGSGANHREQANVDMELTGHVARLTNRAPTHPVPATRRGNGNTTKRGSKVSVDVIGVERTHVMAIGCEV